MWFKNKKQRADIPFLKKHLDVQTKASKIVTDYLYRSVEQTVTYMNKLVEEKQEREEEMAMSSNVKDILMSTFTTFLSQMETLQGFVDRETWLKSQLIQAEQNNHKLLEELHKVSTRDQTAAPASRH